MLTPPLCISVDRMGSGLNVISPGLTAVTSTMADRSPVRRRLEARAAQEAELGAAAFSLGSLHEDAATLEEMTRSLDLRQKEARAERQRASFLDAARARAAKQVTRAKARAQAVARRRAASAESARRALAARLAAAEQRRRHILSEKIRTRVGRHGFYSASDCGDAAEEALERKLRAAAQRRAARLARHKISADALFTGTGYM